MCRVEKFEEPEPLHGKSFPIYYKITSSGCHECVSHLPNIGGYFDFIRNRKRWKIHRYVFTIIKCDILPGLLIRHICNNPSCINTDHLIAGTHKDNANDRKFNNKPKKKHKYLMKEEKLIIASDKQHTAEELAEIYTVSYSTIVNIRKKYSEAVRSKAA